MTANISEIMIDEFTTMIFYEYRLVTVLFVIYVCWVFQLFMAHKNRIHMMEVNLYKD